MNPELFKVKAALRDPVFWTTVAIPALRYFDPSLASWLANHWQLLAPYAVFIAGHMGIRMQGTKALGAASAWTDMGQALEVNAPAGDPPDAALSPDAEATP